MILSVLPRTRHRLLAALLLVTAGCSTTRVVTHHDPAVDLGSYRTYGFLDPLGTDTGDYQSLTSRLLSEAAARELEARGYERFDTPDLLVNFHLTTAERIRSAPSGSSYFLFRTNGRWPYGVWGGYPTYDTVHAYTEGTLHLDLVDRSRRQVVWDAAIVRRLDSEELSDPQSWAQEDVRLAFAEFPVGRVDGGPSEAD